MQSYFKGSFELSGDSRRPPRRWICNDKRPRLLEPSESDILRLGGGSLLQCQLIARIETQISANASQETGARSG